MVLVKLDQIDADNDQFYVQVRSFHALENYSIVGFSNAHPICLSGTLLLLGLERWPSNPQVYNLTAKYLAIAPEKNTELVALRQRMAEMGLKGSVAKRTMQQIASLMKRRETELSVTLKHHIARLSKKLDAAKRRLRQVWDLILAGNINEMNSAFNRTHESVSKVGREVLELCRLYPNNRFVARMMYRYQKELVADQAKMTEWKDKIASLQRGIMVEVDLAHELGCSTFKTLPQSLDNKLRTDKYNTNSLTNTGELLDDDMTTTSDIERSTFVDNEITKLKISAPLISEVGFSLLVLVFFIVPTIFLGCFMSHYITQSMVQINYMRDISYIRFSVVIETLYSQQYLLESTKLPSGEYFFEHPDVTGLALNIFGGSRDITFQLGTLSLDCMDALQQLSKFQVYNPDSKQLKEIIALIFEDQFDFIQCNNLDDQYVIVRSAFEVATNMNKQVSFIANDKKHDASVFTTPPYLNLIRNHDALADRFSDCLTRFTEAITTDRNHNDKIMLVIEIVITVGLAAFLIYGAFTCLKRLKETKRNLFLALTTLPKNVISQVSDSTRVITKDSDATKSSSHIELSKQEDNIIRSLGSVSDTQSSDTNFLVTMLIAIISMIAAGCVFYFYFTKFFRDVWDSIYTSAPHLDFSLGATTYQISAMILMNQAYMNKNGYANIHPNFDQDVEATVTQMEAGATYFNTIRFGGYASDEKPCPSIELGLDSASHYLPCPDPTKPPNNFHDTFVCYAGDFQMIVADVLVREILRPVHVNVTTKLDSRDPDHAALAALVGIIMPDGFFIPMFNELEPTMMRQLDDIRHKSVIAIVVICLIACLILLYMIIILNQFKDEIKYDVSLLRHIPSPAILQTKKLMKILAGNFKSQDSLDDHAAHDFYSIIFKGMLDPVCVMDKQGDVVSSVNDAYLRVFKIERDEVEKLPFALKIIGDWKKEDGKYEVSVGETSFLMTIMTTQSGLTFLFRDRTQTLIHQKLISDEKSKTDKLLASILPSSLIPRVQAGETNISFAVQSASIVFMDIVEFTPWCAANTATYVMSTLNKLYAKYDMYVASFETMMRIKCIGDCYMAAGGIFSTLNNPAEHAKDAVSFGLHSIAAIKEMNIGKEIRVGINTGGPIVAGVIGQAKPTFEIIGKAINVAEQMESHGVPMRVHISRSVYELIYGGPFKIQERGMTEIKNGSVLTYIVIPED